MEIFEKMQIDTVKTILRQDQDSFWHQWLLHIRNCKKENIKIFQNNENKFGNLRKNL